MAESAELKRDVFSPMGGATADNSNTSFRYSAYQLPEPNLGGRKSEANTSYPRRLETERRSRLWAGEGAPRIQKGDRHVFASRRGNLGKIDFGVSPSREDDVTITRHCRVPGRIAAFESQKPSGRNREGRLPILPRFLGKTCLSPFMHPRMFLTLLPEKGPTRNG